MGELHVFQDDHDTWIAESKADAERQARELYDDYSDYELTQFGEMRQLPDGDLLTIHTDDGGAEDDGYVAEERAWSPGNTYTIWSKTQPCSEWAKLGRMHLSGGDND